MPLLVTNSIDPAAGSDESDRGDSIKVSGKIDCVIFEPNDNLDPLMRDQGEPDESGQALTTNLETFRSCHVSVQHIEKSLHLSSAD